VNPNDLWRLVTAELKAYVDRAVRDLLAQLPALQPGDALMGGRLLSVVVPPAGNPLTDLVRDITGELDADSPVRLHGWRRAPNAGPGIALVIKDPADPTRLAAVAVTPDAPDNPLLDVVVSGGAALTLPNPPNLTAEWSAAVTVDAPDGWDVAAGGPPPPSGSASVTVKRTASFQAGMTTGPGMRLKGFAITLEVHPPAAPVVTVQLRGVEVAILPAELARLVGASPNQPAASNDSAETTITLEADRINGVRFAGGSSLRLPIPLRLNAPGLQSRGTAFTLSQSDGSLHLGVVTSLTASLPGLPLRATVADAGSSLPLRFPAGKRPSLDPAGLRALTPDGIGVNLALPPVSGGGFVRKVDDTGWGGVIAVDLGVIGMQAVAVFRPPNAQNPTTSFVVVLAAQFPPPGIQLSFGFALDAVGGLVGINHRVDVTEISRLVSDGHADRILFPERVVERADEVIGALSAAFPPARNRFVIAPMVRITWGGRMVSLSGALILELPAPVQAVILGRLLVAVPDPVVPLIRLQASILGRFDPGVPSFELLVSLAGSWIVGLAVRGEIYLLVRGGDRPEFVLSAGGFHPRYVRPAGVPALQRLQMDLRPGFGFGMSIEAYFAVTSNAVQFGGLLHLEAMIAKCGVEGWLGLDALFRFDPTFSFSVRIFAGVAVRAFGHRLASVGLDFTLEGPAPWHAFGTGSISVLFWDVDLDFDIAWGAPAAVTARIVGDDLSGPVKAAINKPDAWIIERPSAERTGLTFTRMATEEMTAGTLVHPDSTFRVSQAVVPLDVVFTKYSRRRIAEQRWAITSVQVGVVQPADRLGDLAERFVRGELFELTEDEQLTAPPTSTHNSGKQVVTGGFRLGAGHRVDDGYETAYKPELEGPHDASKWPGLYAQETALSYSAVERLQRWAPAAVTVGLRPPALRTVAGPSLRPIGPTLIAMDLNVSEEVAAQPTAEAAVETPVDLWQVMRDQLRDPTQPNHFLEAWEVPA
jgi:hypothetical protein